MSSSKYPPNGVGIYIRRLSRTKHGTPEQAARRAKNHGISFVAIMAIWQEEKYDKIINKNMSEYIEAFIDEGIDIWLWGYPWSGKEFAFVNRFDDILSNFDPGKIRGIILDPELGYKYNKINKSKQEVFDNARFLIRAILELLYEDEYLGVTSYSNTNIHKTFPWEPFCGGFGSPQLYTCKTKKQVVAGLESWKKRGWDQLVPSVPAYGPNSSQNLEKYLKWFPRETIDGFIVWSWRQLNKDEWKTLEKVAGWF